MKIPTALYNLASTAPVGLLAGLCIIAVAGVALWQSGNAGLQQKQKTILTAVLFGITGLTMLVVTAYLALVQIDFTEKADNTTFGDLPSVTAVAMWAQLGVVLVLVGTLVAALIKRHAIGTAGAAFLLTVSLAVYADLGLFRMFQDSWALGILLGWFAIVVTGVVFMATVATVKIRAYGRRQFERGQMTALDSVQARSSEVITA